MDTSRSPGGCPGGSGRRQVREHDFVEDDGLLGKISPSADSCQRSELGLVSPTACSSSSSAILRTAGYVQAIEIPKRILPRHHREAYHYNFLGSPCRRLPDDGNMYQMMGDARGDRSLRRGWRKWTIPLRSRLMQLEQGQGTRPADPDGGRSGYSTRELLPPNPGDGSVLKSFARRRGDSIITHRRIKGRPHPLQSSGGSTVHY